MKNNALTTAQIGQFAHQIEQTRLALDWLKETKEYYEKATLTFTPTKPKLKEWPGSATTGFEPATRLINEMVAADIMGYLDRAAFECQGRIATAEDKIKELAAKL